jgi:hypothetical protein
LVWMNGGCRIHYLRRLILDLQSVKTAQTQSHVECCQVCWREASCVKYESCS